MKAAAANVEIIDFTANSPFSYDSLKVFYSVIHDRRTCTGKNNIIMASIEKQTDGQSKRHWGTVLLLTIFTMVSISMLILIVLSVLVPPTMDQLVETFTSAERSELPVVELSESERDEIEARVDAFEAALQTEEFVEPLELTMHEINGLLAGDDEKLQSHLSIRDGHVFADLSLPIEDDLEFGPWRSSMQGRFINGTAELAISLKDDILSADLISFMVDGNDVPLWLRSILQRELDTNDWLASEDLRDITSRLERITFQDDSVTLYPNEK